mgnify:CR=1 FL=1
MRLPRQPWNARASLREAGDAKMLSSFSIVAFIARLFDFYQLLIFIWCILSWIPLSSEGLLADLAHAIDTLVRPFLGVFRRLMPPFGGLDFSPILALVVLRLIEQLIMAILI